MMFLEHDLAKVLVREKNKVAEEYRKSQKALKK